MEIPSIENLENKHQDEVVESKPEEKRLVKIDLFAKKSIAEETPIMADEIFNNLMSKPAESNPHLEMLKGIFKWGAQKLNLQAKIKVGLMFSLIIYIFLSGLIYNITTILKLFIH